MAYNRSHARSICSKEEYPIFEASLRGHVSKLSDTELQSFIKLARTARDKNRDLYRRQSLAIKKVTGTKRGSSNQANDRTQQKDKLFTEALQRLEAERDRR